MAMSDQEFTKRRNEWLERTQQEQAGLSSGLMWGIGIAGTVAMGTSLAYRVGYGPYIDRGLNFLSRFSRGMSRNMPSKDLREWTISDVLRAGDDVVKNAKSTFKDLKEHPFRIDWSDNRSFFGTSQMMYGARQSNYSQWVGQAWRQQRYINPAREDLSKMAQHFGLDENEIRRHEEFINRIAPVIERDSAVYRVTRELGLNNSPSAVILAQKIRNRVDKKAYGQFRDEQRKVYDQIRKKFGDIEELERKFGTRGRTNREKFLSKLYDVASGGDRAATVEEILKNENKFSKTFNYGTSREKHFDPIEGLRKMKAHFEKHDAQHGTDFAKRFMNVTPDQTLRVDAFGKFYSSEGRQFFFDKLVKLAANTLTGKILRMRDVEYSRRAPQFLQILQGTGDPILAALTNRKENQGQSRVDSTMYRIYDKMYRYEGGELKEIEELRGISTHLASGEHGTRANIIRQMAGDTRRKLSDNWFFRTFDLFQDRESFSGKSPSELIKTFTDKYQDNNYIGNIIDNVVSGHKVANSPFEYVDRATTLREFMDSTTYEFSRDTARKLSSTFTNAGSLKLLDVLQETNLENILSRFQTDKDFAFHNSKLANMLQDVERNRDYALSSITQQVSRERVHIGSGYLDPFKTSYSNEMATFEDSLRKEISKEAMMREAFGSVEEYEANKKKAWDETFDLFQLDENGNIRLNQEVEARAELAKQSLQDAESFQSVLDKMGNADLSRRDLAEAERLMHLSRVEKIARVKHSTAEGELTDLLDEEDVGKEAELYQYAFQSDDPMAKELHRVLKQMKSEQLDAFTQHYVEADEIGNPLKYNRWITVRDAPTLDPLEWLAKMNDWTKFKADAKLLGKTLFAGRNNMGDVTEYTMAPYFLTSRLSDEINSHLGLGFSSDSMGSLGQMWKNIMLKRVAPAVFIGTQLEWADDTSEELTGQSISGAAAQGVANVDLAIRKTFDTFGITDWLKEEKQINPIMQYWGEHNDFRSFEEQKEYYAHGYDPVRKGAWWTFGGVNEARGGEIQYWTPSWVRRIQSDYKDKSLYDGYWDKWSHSLIPTPLNPLSPIAGILDPYWLEEKHKDDRPYELSGHIWADGTPWGAILNPTIGEIIKPQKSLNTFLGFDYRNINGIDPKALLHAINMEIRQKARDIGHRNYMKIRNDDFSPSLLNEYYAPTEDTRVGGTTFKQGALVNYGSGTYGVYSPELGDGGLNVINGGGTSLAQILNAVNDQPSTSLRREIDAKFFGGPEVLPSMRIVETPDGKVAVQDIGEKDNHVTNLSVEDTLEYRRLTNHDHLFGSNADTHDLENLADALDPRNVIRRLNWQTKMKVTKAVSPYEVDADEVLVSGDKLRNYRPVNSLELINDPDTVTQLINSSKGAGFIQNAATSFRLVGGIYGYGIGAATGFGVDNWKRVPTGQDITSFSRTFWDLNLGGAGGSTMEIIRRFIPDFRRNARVSPLMNNMPDWLPERFKYGDSISMTPLGEARLPGKGYEALNELHPDQYANDGYGAFDRMKILADIAPFSPEYRMWRDIAKKTVTDPDLIQQMQEIRDRVNQQGKKHDFYDYKVVGRGLDYNKVVVSEVLGYGRFRSGNTIYKIAGASVRGNDKQSMQQVLGQYIQPGMEVTVAVDDGADRNNKDSVRSIDAAVFVNGDSVAQQMIDNGDATIRKGDTSAAATIAHKGPIQHALAWTSEIVGHLDVPWLSDQFLRIRSPLESYKAEQVYGTPYQSWEHPIDTMLLPAIERAFHDRSIINTAISEGTRYLEDIPGLSKGNKRFLTMGYLLSDRGAFIGAALSKIIGASDRNTMSWARFGTAIASIGHTLTGGNSYLDEATSMANVGWEVARFFEKKKGVGALIGAGVGVAYRAAFGDTNDWIPDRVQKNWAVEDYFDRLTYIKYQGLYNAAAEKASDEEGVDVRELIEEREEKIKKSQAQIENFQRIYKDLQRNARDSDERQDLMKKLNQKIQDLEYETMLLPGGEWTRTALLYKQAADNTMYGLTKDATWSQIVTALPTNDREYFMEFVKQRDEDKRQEILKYVSPSLARALSLAWYQEETPKEDNEEYFQKHQLPLENWAGWAPQYDLRDIQVKTVANEAMNLSDFGFYESQLSDPNVIYSPDINIGGDSNSDNSLRVKQNLNGILKGAGLEDVDISVQPGPSGGLTSIFAAIKTMIGFRQEQKLINDGLIMQTS